VTGKFSIDWANYLSQQPTHQKYINNYPAQYYQLGEATQKITDLNQYNFTNFKKSQRQYYQSYFFKNIITPLTQDDKNEQLIATSRWEIIKHKKKLDSYNTTSKSNQMFLNEFTKK
jgi:hypothetical protein